MKTEEPSASESSRDETAKLPNVRKVLIVDDDQEASQAIAELVRDIGYEPMRCSHAPAALDLLRMEEIDLILADYRMPEMTGLDLMRMLREDGCTIPVIIMTGYAGSEDRLSSEKGDRCTVLRKPLNQPELRNAIQQCFSGVPASL